jgi:hypothetical protein
MGVHKKNIKLLQQYEKLNANIKSDSKTVRGQKNKPRSTK